MSKPVSVKMHKSLFGHLYFKCGEHGEDVLSPGTVGFIDADYNGDMIIIISPDLVSLRDISQRITVTEDNILRAIAAHKIAKAINSAFGDKSYVSISMVRAIAKDERIGEAIYDAVCKYPITPRQTEVEHEMEYDRD